MCDSFDMACRDGSNALHLNIKVNSENLLPNTQKYNVGSLRLPADPSWPKIPQRRLADDLGDIIEPPCVVTLTGTPRKSRTTVRSPNSHQSARSNFSKDQVSASFHQSIYQKTPPPGNPVKRRPGCADPRFKKVTTVKSQGASSDPSAAKEHDNSTEISRSDVIIPNQMQCTDSPKVTQQEAEKPGEIRGMDSIGVQTMQIEDPSLEHPEIDATGRETSKEEEEKNLNATNDEKNPGSLPKINDVTKIPENLRRSSTNEKIRAENHCLDSDEIPTKKNEGESQKNNSQDSGAILTIVPTNSVSVVQPESTCLQYCQSNTGQFFLVVENKSQSPSIGSLQIEPKSIPACQYTTQCYNVQVPVLSYQNLPLQISTQQKSQSDQKQLTIPSVLTIPSSSALPNPGVEITNLNFPRLSEDQKIKETTAESQELQKSNFPTQENLKSNLPQETKENFATSRAKENLFSSPDLEPEKSRKTLTTPPIKLKKKFDFHRKCEQIGKKHSDGISESFKASRTQQLLSDTTDSEIYAAKPTALKNRLYCSKETSRSGSDYETNFEGKFRQMSDDLSQLKSMRKNGNFCSPSSQGPLGSGRYGNPRNRDQESSMDEEESLMTSQMPKTRNAHRKMKSEQNLPRSAMIGEKNHKQISDPHITGRETFAIENRGKYSPSRQKIHHRSAGKETIGGKMFCNRVHTDLTTDDVDSDVQNLLDFCDTHRTEQSNVEQSKKSPILTDDPNSLPIETQQLLNKSYLEYYDKLRSRNIPENSEQRFVCQVAMGAPQLKKRRADLEPESVSRTGEINETKTEILTMEKLSTLSNIINRNLNPVLQNSLDPMQTQQIFVNENIKSSSDPTAAATQSAIVPRILMTGNSSDVYDSSVLSTSPANKLKRKRDKPVERRLLKFKTIVFFGFMIYALTVLLPIVYNYYLYDEYDDYEDLSYIELVLEYVVSSFREAFGGFFDAINDTFFRPVSVD